MDYVTHKIINMINHVPPGTAVDTADDFLYLGLYYVDLSFCVVPGPPRALLATRLVAMEAERKPQSAMATCGVPGES